MGARGAGAVRDLRSGAAYVEAPERAHALAAARAVVDLVSGERSELREPRDETAEDERRGAVADLRQRLETVSPA